jgi:hypothetical protein
MFNAIDTDGNGFISTGEMRQALVRLAKFTGIRPAEVEINALMRNADTESDGHVDYFEFRAKIETHLRAGTMKMALKECVLHCVDNILTVLNRPSVCTP